MSDQDISALRQQLHHLRTHGVLREACSLLLDQVAACRLGVTTVDALKKSRAWATAKGRHTVSPEGASVVAQVVALVEACEVPP